MAQTLEANRFIRELQNTIIVAEMNFEIWWVYKDNETRPKYYKSMDRYNEFFRTSIHAHFVANVIALYTLYEKRSDSMNVNRLLSHDIKAKLPDDFTNRLNRAKEIWTKISIIRSNCFAHRNGEQAVDALFKKAALTPNEIRELMCLTKHILTDISREWNASVDFFDVETRADTVRLLDDLNRCST